MDPGELSAEEVIISVLWQFAAGEWLGTKGGKKPHTGETDERPRAQIGKTVYRDPPNPEVGGGGASMRVVSDFAGRECLAIVCLFVHGTPRQKQNVTRGPNRREAIPETQG